MPLVALLLRGVVMLAEPGQVGRIDPEFEVATMAVDPAALRRSLEARVGAAWRTRRIRVADVGEGPTIELRVESGDGTVRRRVLVLHGTTPTERSQELASVVALLMESGPPRVPSEPAPSPRIETEPPTRSIVTGWGGVGLHLGLNASRSPHINAGVGLMGGLWIAGEHLQPVVVVDWSQSRAGALRVNALRGGGGLFGGSAIAERRWWIGAGGLARAQWAQAREVRVASGWWTSLAAAGLVQYRGPRVGLGLLMGVDIGLPPLRARGGTDELRWNAVRPMVALHIGIRRSMRSTALE